MPLGSRTLVIIFIPIFAFAACSKASPGNAPSSAASGRTGVININTATAADLERLPHIGPGTAQKIVEYRTAHDGFRRIEELMLIPGISDERFREIRDLVFVE